jgi:hypothetical protein
MGMTLTIVDMTPMLMLVHLVLLKWHMGNTMLPNSALDLILVVKSQLPWPQPWLQAGCTFWRTGK